MALREQAQVVLVEDDAGVRQALARLLKAAGCEVQVFASAEALMEAACARDADCLILDIQLPGLSGFELQEALERAGTRRPVIFITGHDEPAFRHKARSLEAAYLTKPLGGQALLEAIAAAITPR